MAPSTGLGRRRRGNGVAVLGPACEGLAPAARRPRVGACTARLALGWLLAAGALAGALAQAQPAAPPAAVPAPSPSAAPPAAASLQVQRYEVQGNTLLPEAQLQSRLAGFTGTATLERLRAAAAAVQALYREAGFGGVVAFLPEQDLAGGRVLVRVVEGRLARVEVTGQQQYSIENIRASLPSLQEGRTPNVRRIDAEIQIANENPAKTVQVLLQPGSAPGEVAAAVTVEEQPVARWSARLDNTGGAQVGRWRAALGWQHANMLGRDHVLALEVQTAPEDTSAVASVSGSWRMPLYGRALAADVYGAWSNVDVSKVGTGLGGDLAFTGKGVILGGRLSAYLPRLGNIDQRASLGVELRDYRNSCSLGQQAGVCDSVSVHPLTLGYTVQAASDWRWGAGVTLSHNLGLGGSHGSAADFAAVREGARRRYTVLRANGQLALPLTEQWQLQARASGQWTDTPLVPGEMFGAGGAQSVRGYEERELSGDTGLTLGLDLVGPNLAPAWLGEERAAGIELRPVAFADAGSVHVLGTQSCQAGQRSCSVSGAGLGLRLQWQGLSLRLDVAMAGRDAATTQAGDWRTHVLLSYSF